MALRLSDAAHTHPTAPPTSEASSDPDVLDSIYHGWEHLGLEPIVDLQNIDLATQAAKPEALQAQITSTVLKSQALTDLETEAHAKRLALMDRPKGVA